MNLFGSNLGGGFGLGGLGGVGGVGPGGHETVAPQLSMSRLQWVMQFCDVDLAELNDSVIARRRVQFYLELDREMERRDEVRELERQWNPLGRFG